jgi:hypothetical protein
VLLGGLRVRSYCDRVRNSGRRGTAGPAVIGLVADKIGLHLALLIPLALAAWIAVAASALRTPQGGDPDHDFPSVAKSTT